MTLDFWQESGCVSVPPRSLALSPGLSERKRGRNKYKRERHGGRESEREREREKERE